MTTASQASSETAQLDAPFEYVFPAIRGIQAKREYYTSMCPLRLLPKIFLFDEDELNPEIRAQRHLNKARLPEMARYVVGNAESYVFSAITASIDGEVSFQPLASGKEGYRVGLLRVPMSARFVINDGQHRRAAIELALRENPDLGDESIAVVFFMDRGLERSQQMFADLNRYSIRPTTSLAVLYDHRDEMARLTKLVVLNSPLFKDVVEMEKTTLAARSRRLFTLSALYRATSALVTGFEGRKLEELSALAQEFWEEVAQQFPEWKLVREGTMAASEVRSDFIHSHGIVLLALGRAGNMLLSSGVAWKRKLKTLQKVDWRRTNTSLWEGRAMIGGTVSKAGHNVTLTTNVVKKQLGLDLTPEERRVETAYSRGSRGK